MTKPAVTPGDAPHSTTPIRPWKKAVPGYIGLIGVLFLIGAVSGFLNSEADFAGCWKPGAIFAFAGFIGVVLAAASYRVAQRLRMPKLVQSMVAFGLAFSAMHAIQELLNNRFDSALSKSFEGLCLGIVCGAMLHAGQKYRLFRQIDPNANSDHKPQQL